MKIYGVALLSACYLIGQLLGEYLGSFLGVKANVGGVGFAMLLLIFASDWLQKKQKLHELSVRGIEFWSLMYIPIIVAMASTQNVKAAFSSGFTAILVGLVPTVLCFVLIPYLSKAAK